MLLGCFPLDGGGGGGGGGWQAKPLLHSQKFEKQKSVKDRKPFGPNKGEPVSWRLISYAW